MKTHHKKCVHTGTSPFSLNNLQTKISVRTGTNKKTPAFAGVY